MLAWPGAHGVLTLDILGSGCWLLAECRTQETVTACKQLNSSQWTWKPCYQASFSTG